MTERVQSQAWDGAGTPSISVIVPTHDRAAFLPELIASLEAQTLEPAHFEVVVVDDASTDETWEVLRRLASATPLRMLSVRAEGNRGPAATRNLAVSLTRAPAFAFTDDDCLPTPGWLDAIAGGLRDADVVQGRTLPRPSEQAGAGPWARTVWITAATQLYETCNIGWRRETFERLGGFAAGRPDAPTGTRAHFGEDAELGWRLIAGGGTTAYRPAALVHHRVHPGTFADWLAERRRLRLFPDLVRRAPGLRRAMRLGVFLSWDTALFDLALAGGVAGLISRKPWPALAALPWLAARWRQAGRKPGRSRLARLGQLAAGDAVGLVSLAGGSLRSRRAVL
ncbi:MAG: glycosyltransferase family A protein [Actinomycetota bacterium]